MLPNQHFRSFCRGKLQCFALPLLTLTTGCSGSAAPSYALFGAYFPAWLLCGIIGIIGAILARFAFLATNLATVIPAQLFVCLSVGIILASLIWLVWLGQ